MSLLFESISVAERSFRNLDYHNARLNRSRRELFGCADAIDLEKVLELPAGLPASMHKCRVEYTRGIERVEFVPYRPASVQTLSIVVCDTIAYGHKFVDRSVILRLLEGAGTDDILIVKQGLITDSSIANVVFHDGSRWLTPAAPLLPGTARARLLHQGRIAAAAISVGDLTRFTKLALINAMLDLDETPQLPIDAIIDLRRGGERFTTP